MNSSKEDGFEGYFVKQKKIYQSDISGYFRNMKWAAMLILLSIYYFTPFIRWDRGPYLPNQAVLIDLSERRAYFFAIEIWPEEVFYLAGILIISAIGLFMVTSMFGRIWCGYACPQTVWVDLFIRVECLIQGDRNARIKLDASPFSFEKLYKKFLTHIIWLLISLLTGGAWVMYFNDAPSLLNGLINFQISSNTAIWVLSLTASTYLMAGFAREQVCNYVCPYARFQSAMFDAKTMIIGYDQARGDPRGKHNKNDPKGACIDCGRCVTACPQGIDIREGLQLGCIACGLCIDACNDVMEKLKMPLNLIRYGNEETISDNKEKFKLLSHVVFRPRVFVYVFVIGFIGCGMLYSLFTRPQLEIKILHDRSPLFVLLSDGEIRNGYIIRISNKTYLNKRYRLIFNGIKNAEIKIPDSDFNNELHVIPDNINSYRVFVSAKQNYINADEVPVNFVVEDVETGVKASYKSMFISNKSGQ